MYLINGNEYHLKEKYSLKDWGKIIEIIGGVDVDNKDGFMNSLTYLLAEDRLKSLLNLLFDKTIESELYEDDFGTASLAITDFFSRKKSLIKNIHASSKL